MYQLQSMPYVLIYVASLMFIMVYFVPTYIACIRGHQNRGHIFFVNLVAGWSVLGWGAALIWAFVGAEPVSSYAPRSTSGRNEPKFY